MKVIFIEDVPNVARAGETRVVADGYGRNYLLPRRLAVLADSRASAIVKSQLKKRERMAAQTEAEMRELAGKLAGLEIMLKAKAGAKERLYGSITSADIAEALSRKVGSLVDKRKVEMEQPIHQLGSCDVTVRFTHEISAVIKLTVVGEEGEVAAPKEEKKAEVKAEAASPAAEPGKAEKKEKKPKAEKKAEPAEAKEEKKAEKKTKAKAEKKAEPAEVVEEKKEKKSKAKAEKTEEPAGAKPEKAEKKGKAKKKVEEAGEKDAEPGK